MIVVIFQIASVKGVLSRIVGYVDGNRDFESGLEGDNKSEIIESI